MELSREVIDSIIRTSINSKDFEFVSCEDCNLGDVPIGFFSSQEKKCIKYKTLQNEGEIHIFIKQLPHKELQKAMTVQLGCFQRESLVYSNILADFHEYELPTPKCFLTDPTGLVVLEDLSQKGYRNKHLYEPLNIKECHKVLDSLSKFHAASFIIENKEGHKLNALYPQLEEEIVLNPHENHYGKMSCLVSVKALKAVSEKYFSHYSKEVIAAAFSYMEHVFENLQSSKSNANALSHMDVWLNNIMFKYDDSGELQDTRLVDLQCVTYKPPAFDVQFFLHTCTTKEFRTNFYHHLLMYYFDSLSNQLLQSGINPDGIMTRNDFQNSIEETLPFVLAVTPMCLKFILMPLDTLKDALDSDEKYNKYAFEDRTSYALQAISENEHYRLRIFDCLTELFDYFKLRYQIN